MGQGKGLFELLLQAEDPYVFTQNLIERWGAVQLIGRGEVTQTQLFEALKHIETNPLGAQAPEGQLDIEEQVKLLRLVLFEALPDLKLDASQVEGDIAIARSWMKPGFSSLFCYVRTETLAAHFKIKKPWENFGVLTEKTLELLATRRSFHNYRVGQMSNTRHRLLGTTKSAMQAAEAAQKGDIIVLPMQLGELYRGQSVDDSRKLIEMSGSQFCLPAFIVGQVLLANPDLLVSRRDLFIDCPGDEYRFERHGRFGESLCFKVNGGSLYCLLRWTVHAEGNFGSASGFVR